jgi:hypothetical protein
MKTTAVALAIASVTASAFAAADGPLEARRMLEAAITALKDDQESALRRFNGGDPAFRQGDLYVFCADATGTIVAHGLPDLIGRDLATFKDKTGKDFGLHILNAARFGEVKFTGYYFPKPHGSSEVYKEDYFTRIGNLTCGVGYYSTKTQ